MTPPGWGKTMSEAKQTNLKNIPHPALRDEPYAWQAVGGTIWTSEDNRPLKPQYMTYEEFLDFVRAKCMYETIYDDSDGRTILVIRMLDAYKFLMGGR